MIYLDHAATSFPKPPAVVAAVQHWLTEVGVSPDRGEGPSTRESAAVVQRCREGIASRTGHRPERVAFCSGATEGLNLVLRALVKPGARVLTTWWEHSSVVRPLTALQQERGASIERVATADELCERIRSEPPDLVVFSHASNVTGMVTPASTVCLTARNHGVPVVLDASQTAGYRQLDEGADCVVASAHKGLHAPPGLGFVSVDERLELAPQKQGGTGSSVALDHHPTEWPQAFEAGTPNMPALFGLAAALSWLEQQEQSGKMMWAGERIGELLAGLRDLPGFRVVGQPRGNSTPVLSLVHESYDPLELGSILAGAGIHVRAGYHCAPWAHERLGTAATGTLRISAGPSTRSTEIDAVLDVLRTL
jgi:selenocysteine lyase/cysteine desulfurase